MTLLRQVFDFGLPEVRARAFFVLIIAALLSPNITMPDPLPAVRLEQFILAVFLPSLLLHVWRNPAARTIRAIDIVFAALAALVTLTLLVAPIMVSDVGRNVRDIFELARIAEYWLLFRLGLTVVPNISTMRTTVGVLLLGAIGMTAFSLLQYLGPGGFNDTVTSLWTTEHNLEGVVRRGRVLGTTGNANYYGIFSGFLVVLALAMVMLRQRLGGGWLTWIPPIAIFAATLSLVMSQSRTATFAILGAMFLGLLFVAWQRRGGPHYGRSIGLFVAAAVVSVGFVELVPPQFGTFHERFAPAALTEDSSVTIRISKWRSVFAGFFESRPDFCQGEPLETRSIASGHLAASDTGAPPASDDAIARDEQRKADVAIIAGGVVDYFCANDRWPTEESLAAALVPGTLDEMPIDPATGEHYLHYVTGGGITIGAELENPADPEGPIYTLSTIPNFVLNPSFESGATSPNSWQTTGSGSETDAEATLVEDGLFGNSAVEVAFPPGGTFFQNVVYEFPVDTPHTASLWLRSTSGEDEEVQIYLIAQFPNGDIADPFAQQMLTVPGDGAWMHASVQFDTPPDRRIHVLRYMIRTQHDGEPATVQMDGAALTRGPFAPNFQGLRDVDPASLTPQDLPSFSDSPLIGVGPRHNEEVGSVDNEYVLFLERYGLLGTLAYVALWVTAFIAAWMAWRRGNAIAAVLALAMMVFIVALAVFNVAAGSFYHFQMMAVFWLLVGLLSSAARRRDHEGQEPGGTA